jgi:hypothetical protein
MWGARAQPCTGTSHKINRDSGLRERDYIYLHAVSRQVISQEIAELEAAHQGDTTNPTPLSTASTAVLGVSHEPRVPTGHLRAEIMSNSCDPQAWEHGGDEETADVARESKGAAPRRDGLRHGARRAFGRWGQPAAPRPALPVVEFLEIMAKNEFRLQRETGDQGGKTQ